MKNSVSLLMWIIFGFLVSKTISCSVKISDQQEQIDFLIESIQLTDEIGMLRDSLYRQKFEEINLMIALTEK